jgi:sugar/nucleoside kinase (ribokinase family)
MCANSNHHTFPRFVVIGYANHDVNRFSDGTEHFCVGGGGYFAALAASRIVPDAALVTRVGEDFNLAPLTGRVVRDAVSVISGGKTALSLQIYHDPNDLTNRSIDLKPGVNPGITASDIPGSWVAHASVILVSTMMPAQQRGVVEALVAKKRAETLSLEGVSIRLPLIAVDSDLCWLKDEESTREVRAMMRHADIAFMNRTEGDILEDLIPQIPLVVLKRDAEGAELLVWGKRQSFVPAPEVSVVDVTGAGDVVAGTFLASLVSHRGAEESLVAAVQAASQSITKEGIEHMLNAPRG